jgi:glycosyltransferase involved in cell wall biosynthesis
MERSVARADAIIAISDTTRRDLVELYSLPEEKIKVIYLGVDGRFRPVKEECRIDAVRRRYKLPSRFVLAVASVHPRKNLRRLIESFALLKAKSGLPHSLIVAGKQYGEDDPAEYAARLGLRDAFRYLDYVDPDDLPALYGAADLFVFPSLYEGFGLPPLEAMACGTPVAASDAGSLPEVLGDAARYFDPQDTKDMATVMGDVIVSQSERERLRSQGLSRVRRFQWNKCALETMALYESLL